MQWNASLEESPLVPPGRAEVRDGHWCTSILERCARRTATITSCCLHSSLQQKASGGTPQHSAAHSDDYILLFIVCLRLGKVTFFCFLQIRSLSPPSPPGQIEVVIRTIIMITISTNKILVAPGCTDSLLWSVLSNRDDYILLFTEFATTEGQQRNTATQCSTQRRLHLAVYSLPAFS